MLIRTGQPRSQDELIQSCRYAAAEGVRAVQGQGCRCVDWYLQLELLRQVYPETTWGCSSRFSRAEGPVVGLSE